LLKLMAAVRSALDQMGESMLLEGMRSHGTVKGTGYLAIVGDSPIKNWGGVGVVDLPQAVEKLNGEAFVSLGLEDVARQINA